MKEDLLTFHFSLLTFHSSLFTVHYSLYAELSFCLMFCIKCGSDNLETAKFCRKCGADMGSQQSAVSGQPEETEEETRVATRGPMSNVQSPSIGDRDINGEAEKEIFTISPTLKFVKAGYVGAAVGALLLVAIFSAFTAIWAWVAVLVGLLLFLVPAYYHVRQKLMRYTLTDSKLEIDSGFVSRTTRNVPIRRIQDVTVSATPWQRLLGIGDLVIDNASQEGGKVVLKNIDTPKLYADEVLGQMRSLEK